MKIPEVISFHELNIYIIFIVRHINNLMTYELFALILLQLIDI